MKIFISTLIILALNTGCTQVTPDCPEKKCLYPKLPTYKTPISNNFAVVKHTDHSSIIDNGDLLELVSNNKKLRKVCSNYAVINKRVNKEYQQ